MQRVPRKVIAWSVAVVLCTTGAVVLSVRSLQSDVDESVARIRENYTCSHCGYLFELAIADATQMRRTQGDIVCPKCGKPGAAKNSAESAGALVKNPAQQTDATEETAQETDDASGQRPGKPVSPATGLTRKEGS